MPSSIALWATARAGSIASMDLPNISFRFVLNIVAAGPVRVHDAAGVIEREHRLLEHVQHGGQVVPVDPLALDGIEHGGRPLDRLANAFSGPRTPSGTRRTD